MPPQILDFCSMPTLACQYAAQNMRKKVSVYNDPKSETTLMGKTFSKTSNKRKIDAIDVDNDQKRPQTSEVLISLQSHDFIKTLNHSPMSDVILAADRQSIYSDHVVDGSSYHGLPTVTGKNMVLMAISPETMSAVLKGYYDQHIDHLTVIDCRYPYEFEGGHIRGAINLYTKDSIRNYLNETMTLSDKNHVIIFHCEFSSERVPKMYRHLRSLNRDLNNDSYPRLNFPEVYRPMLSCKLRSDVAPGARGRLASLLRQVQVVGVQAKTPSQFTFKKKVAIP
ncbi:M-phase inducer phosphatase 1-B-like [Mya arenaria]|uniref:M-phase inducer phosphatase 1-B-like n=1 Tax=Mya arenaria TaxID=6604 RepID=UPI0022E628F6|nr:M-phase inducer phosphatase 1-B-like [Mya arenaria]